MDRRVFGLATLADLGSNPRMRARLWWIALFLPLIASPAGAQPADEATRTAARALGSAGVEAYQDGNYTEASTKLEKAFQVLAVPTLGLWSARARVKLGRLVEAAERYHETTALQVPTGEAAVQRQAQADAQTELDQLKPRIPSVVIRLTGAEASEVTLSLDGKPLGTHVLGKRWLLNPGPHSIEATRGAEQAKAQVTLVEGKSEPVVLTFETAGSKASARKPAGPVASAGDVQQATSDGQGRSGSTLRTLAWGALGLGGLGVAAGGVTGVLALSKSGKLDDSDNCAGQTCATSERENVDSVNMLRTISMVGLYAGGALVATGVVLFVISSPKAEPRAALYVAPSGAFVSGAF